MTYDPFRPEINRQLMRQARVGLTVLAIMLGLFAYVAWHKIVQPTRLPDHVLAAPIAEQVWPNSETPERFRQRPSMGESFGELIDSARSKLKPFADTSAGTSKGTAASGIDSTISQQTNRAERLAPTYNNSYAQSRVQNGTHVAETVSNPIERSLPRNGLLEKPTVIESNMVKATAIPSSVPDLHPVSNGASSTPQPSGLTANKDELHRIERPVVAPVTFTAAVPDREPMASMELDQHNPNSGSFKPANFRPLTPRSENAESSIAGSLRPDSLNHDLSPAELLGSNSPPESPAGFDRNRNGALPASASVPPSAPLLDGSQPTASTNSFTPVATHDVESFETDLRPLRPPPHENANSIQTAPTAIPQTRFPASPSELASLPVVNASTIPTTIPKTSTGALLAVDRETTASAGPREQTYLSELRPNDESNQDDIETYRIKQGDSFFTIAQSVYNDGRLFRALYFHNRSVVNSFDSPTPGITISTPPTDELIRLWPEHCPPDLLPATSVSENNSGRFHVTREGDTLFSIARDRLDQASLYLDILRLNEVRLPGETTHLTPLPAGLRLVLPISE